MKLTRTILLAAATAVALSGCVVEREDRGGEHFSGHEHHDRDYDRGEHHEHEDR